MAMTVQRQFESAVTEMYQDAFVGSSIENGVTIITFDLRQHDFQQELGTPARLCWRKESYHVDVHELSTFHNPIKYRFIVAQGSYLNDQNQRVYFTGVWRILRMAQIEHKRISVYARSANRQRTPERISPCSSSLYSIHLTSCRFYVLCSCALPNRNGSMYCASPMR